MGWCLMHVWWIKNSGGIILEWGVPYLHQGPQPRVSVPRREVPTTSGCTSSGDWVGERKCWSPKLFFLKNPHTDSPTQTHSLESFSTGVAPWKATVVYWEKLKCLASRRAESFYPFLNPAPTEPASWCHVQDSINLANTVCPTLEILLDSTPPNFLAHPSCFSIWMAGLASCFTMSYIISNKQQLASVSLRPGMSSSQPRFTTWLHLRISKPSTSSSHLRLLYSPVAPGKTQVGADLALNHLGNPRASAPRGQL